MNSQINKLSRPRPQLGLSGPMGWVVLMAVLLAPLGCGTDAQARSPLANARESEEALVEAVLEALALGDREALQGFLVSRSEYEGRLWPHMPDREHTTFGFVWGLNEVNSRKGLGQLLSQYGGVQLEFVELTFPSEPEVYDDFTLHFILPSFDVFVEYGDVWKLLNYDEL